MKTNLKVIIIVIVAVSIPFGAYQYVMYECGKLSVFMHTPSTPTIWKCIEIWKHQETSESKSQELEEERRRILAGGGGKGASPFSNSDFDERDLIKIP